MLEWGLSDLNAERTSLAMLRYSEKSEDSLSCFTSVSGSKFNPTALTTSRFMLRHRERVAKTYLGNFWGERGHRKYCYKYNKSTVLPPVEMGVLWWFS